MSMLKVKHATRAETWSPVAPPFIIPTLYSLIKRALILLSASHLQNGAASWERSFLGRNAKGYTIHTERKGAAVGRERELVHVPCSMVFSCSTASAFPGSGVERAAGVQVCSKDNANIARAEADTSAGRLHSLVKCQLKNKKQKSITRSLCITSSKTEEICKKSVRNL